MPRKPKPQDPPHPPARPARRPGRVCALDLGAVRVGVAVSDELRLYAHPRGVLDGRDRGALVRAIVEVIAREGVDRILVGFPLDMKGGEGDSARRARGLAQKIADATGLEVELVDERLSTVQARRALAASDVHGKKAKERIDEASAVTVLQAWLDRYGGGG